MDKKKKENLKEELEKCQKVREQYLDSWKRERAAFLNYKKEGAKRIESLTEYIKTGLMMKLLPVLDNFEIAQKEIPEKMKEEENVKGLLQIQKQIKDFLKNEGVEEIDCLDKNFDPNLHDVVGSIEDKERESGIIAEEVQKGYKIKGKLLRPSKVKIVNNKNDKKEENSNKSE